MADTSMPEFWFDESRGSRTYASGETIFSTGDAGNEMFAVQQGWVDLYVGDTLIETVSPGGIFGEMALIDGAARSATAIAGDNCRVLPIDEKRFASLTKKAPDFALNVLRLMSQRVRAMDRR